MRDRLVRTCLILLLGAVGTLAGAACGQDDATPEQLAPANLLQEQIEMQRERIEVLEQQLAELTSERRNVVSTLRRIEGMLAGLRQELDSGNTPAPAVLRAETPSDPLASPESLMRELQIRYRAAMAGLPLETEADRAAFAKQAQLWARLTNRELRGKRSWLVTLEDLASVGDNGSVVRMTVLDETSGLPIGEAVDIGFPAKFLERFSRGSRSGRWVLTSIVIARPVLNESRITPGVFEYPPFVGPMMEFDFDLDWYSLSAWKPGDPVTPPEEVAPAAEPAEDQSPEGA